MALRDIAANDLRAILTDSSRGFGWPITVVSPAGVSVDMVGSSTDISQLIDPQTGQAVSGRAASVAIPMVDLYAAFSNVLPRAVAEAAGKPWLVTFADIAGTSHTFKVSDSNPDRAVGCVSLLLEFYAVTPG